MIRLGKTFALMLILVMAISSASLLMAKPANAQTLPTPSVPEFTVKYLDLSYNVPTTTSIDPYTGQKVTSQGYHVENRTIELTINNQPYNAYSDTPQSYPFLYFSVREKGHFAENWTEIYNPDMGYLLKSSSAYTVVSYSLGIDFPFENGISSGQVDFQVEALVGGVYHISQNPLSGMEFEGVKSGWSATQTVTIPAPTTSPTSTVPELSGILLLPLLLSVFAVAVMVQHRKAKHE